MCKKFAYVFMCFFLCTHALNAEPPKTIPPELINEYTMNGAIPVVPYYRDDSYPPEKPIIYKVKAVNILVQKALKRGNNYYGKTDGYLYSALDRFKSLITDKDVAIMGSVTPWYEAIIISRGAHPYSIDYNRIVSEDPRIKTMTVAEFEANPRLFDVLLSISSYEHDGLGRYGDPLDPNGDLKAMQKAKSMLKPEGILLLAVPIGPDTLCWNAHRIYGKLRLPLLLQGWEIVQSFGFKPERDFTNRKNLNGWHQPVLVLKPIF